MALQVHTRVIITASRRLPIRTQFIRCLSSPSSRLTKEFPKATLVDREAIDAVNEFASFRDVNDLEEKIANMTPEELDRLDQNIARALVSLRTSVEANPDDLSDDEAADGTGVQPDNDVQSKPIDMHNIGDLGQPISGFRNDTAPPNQPAGLVGWLTSLPSHSLIALAWGALGSAALVGLGLGHWIGSQPIPPKTE